MCCGCERYRRTPSSSRAFFRRSVDRDLEGLGTRKAGCRGVLAAHRFEATFGYGLPAYGDRFTMTPEVGFGLSDAGRDRRLCWRFTREGRAGETGSPELRIDVLHLLGDGYGPGEPEPRCAGVRAG